MRSSIQDLRDMSPMENHTVQFVFQGIASVNAPNLKMAERYLRRVLQLTSDEENVRVSSRDDSAMVEFLKRKEKPRVIGILHVGDKVENKIDEVDLYEAQGYCLKSSGELGDLFRRVMLCLTGRNGRFNLEIEYGPCQDRKEIIDRLIKIVRTHMDDPEKLKELINEIQTSQVRIRFIKDIVFRRFN